jgi:uncharacterized protein (DUF3820 family)
MRSLPDDNGGQDKKLHGFIWPQGQWKGRRLVAVPLEYLRKFVKKTPKKHEYNLYNMAKAEIDRRGFGDEYVHVTEHVTERFTQRWADVLMRVQEFTRKPIGVVTIIKSLFRKAIQRGNTIKAEGNKGNNFNVRHGRYRWLYGIYNANKEGTQLEYKIISVVPAKKKQKV